MLYKSKLLTLRIIGHSWYVFTDIVMNIGLWSQVVVLIIDCYIGLFGTCFMQVLYLGRAPRTKETLPDFREKCRFARHSRVFRGLTGSQRTLRFWGVTSMVYHAPPDVSGSEKLLDFDPMEQDREQSEPQCSNREKVPRLRFEIKGEAFMIAHDEEKPKTI